MRRARRRRGPFGRALLASVLLHALLTALAWAGAVRAAHLPKTRVYAVDIVSPPPQALGQPSLGGPVGDPAPEAPPPEPEPPQPEPPAAEPVPPAPKPEAAKPKPTPPAPEARKPAVSKPLTPPKPAAEKPAEPKPPARKPAGGGGAAGSGAGSSTGRNPDAKSAGGDGLNVRIEGEAFSDPAYLSNIIRQLHRYFRPPASARREVAEVYFWINRDGSVADIRLVRRSGNRVFDLAAMEAVEQAGLDKAFGPLPRAYPADRLPISFEFEPAR